MANVAVKYGTPLFYSISKTIAASFPNASKFPPFTNKENFIFSGISPFDKSLCDIVNSTKGYPTVSLLNTCFPESQQALYWWQHNLMKEVGEAEFRKIMQNNLTRGTKFHSTIHQLLNELYINGELNVKDNSFFKEFEDIAGFIKSIMHFLLNLKLNKMMCMEKKVYHPLLCYHGKFDALIEFEDKLTIVDWKTVNTYSTKSQRDNEEIINLKDLYSNPSQLAAYIAAFNACHLFAKYPVIKHGAVVLAYEDGRPAEVVRMNEEEIKTHFESHLKSLNYFWYTIQTQKRDRFGQISFLYNPHDTPNC